MFPNIFGLHLFNINFPKITVCSWLNQNQEHCVENIFRVDASEWTDALRAMDMCSNVGQVASHSVPKWRSVCIIIIAHAEARAHTRQQPYWIALIVIA